MINHRYDILKKLGEGGSGEVFLCRDRFDPSRQYAIKVLHRDAGDGSETAEAFQNEVSILTNLSHPNLAAVYDFGIVNAAEPAVLVGRRFIVMEFVNGREADKWLGDASLRTHEKILLLESLLLQALSALAYVHRNGIIHFDIKPANLVLVGDHAGGAMPLLKLMDFGFSKKCDEVAGVNVRGTLEYTAPELLRGEHPDQRIDLYSLGATFYHLVEHKCPHEDLSSVNLAKRILNEPVAFDEVAWRGLEPIRTVVFGLMQKEPSNRFNSAQHAASALVSAHPNTSEMYRVYFGAAQQPQFVGRKEELALLHRALDGLKAGASETPRSILVYGSEGVGKSMLSREALKYARGLGLSILETDATHPEVPFSGVERAVQRLTAEMMSHSPETAAVVAHYDGLLQLSSNADERPATTWMLEKEKSVEIIARYICECAGFIRTVIFADNIDRLDPVSQAILRIVVRDALRASLVLVATMTGSSDSAPVQVEDSLHVENLSFADAVELARLICEDSTFAETLAAHMMQLYGGAPAVLIEVFNAAKNVLSELATSANPDPSEVLHILEHNLPKDIDDLLLRRFGRLTREQQLLIAVLSCFQHAASVEVLVAVLPFSRRRALDQLRYLQLEGFVTPSADGKFIAISMKRLKDAVYRSVESDRAQMHALIAAGLSTMAGDRSFTILQELGFQFGASGDTEKAASYLEQAGDEALRLFALQRARVLYEEALNNLPEYASGGKRERLVLKHATALFQAEQYRECIATAEALLRKNPPDALLFTIHKLIGLAASRLGETEDARRSLETAISLAPDESERIAVRQELIGLEIASGRFPEAEAACNEQIARASELSDRSALAASYTDLGIAVFFKGEYDRAVGHFTEALKHYDALGEKTKAINAINNIGNALSANGKFAEAIAYWQKAYTESEAYGTANQQAQILNNLGVASFNLKEYAKAQEYYLRARTLYERIDSQIGIAYSLSNIGEVQFAEGDLEAAIASWGGAKALYEAMETPHGHLECCLHLAGAYCRLGDVQSMQTQLHEASELIKSKSLGTFMPRLHLLRGQHYLLRREVAQASEEFAKALAVLDADNHPEAYWQCIVSAAECQSKLGYSIKAVELLHEAAAATERGLPRVFAEAMFQLGSIAVEKPEVVSEKAIVYFKKGLDAVAKEPVGEITWKLAFALAREYHDRGQSERAREYLVKTKLVVQFFLSRFKSKHMRDRYLATDQKDKVLAAIETIIKP